MASVKDPYDRGYRSQGVNDLIFTTDHVAEKAEVHIAFQGPVAEYVTLSPKLKEFAAKMAAARDSGNIDLLNILMPQVVQALDFNADHVIRFSVFRQDASILNNAGYDFKQQNGVKVRVNLLDLMPEITLKHMEGVEGAYVISAKLAKAGAIVEYMWTETPEDEQSWQRIGDGTFNRSRTEVRGGVPTKRIYVRARYHENGAVGRWCKPVSIILL
ncbi:hypothetical protein GMST_19200 [Geomonas silvestris]|uniref:Uncharacterized protein n=1 Tax=Geomonas silvestris TaxID=2740184 RepID=A0A6V8MHX9_9BACT|nr:hypothetical protein [Geomonas silvestris]GFO59595.1 hypothetical protein GMST_19200 [Geomonas silvestris]